MSVQRDYLVDGRNAADIRFEAVTVPTERVLGRIDSGADLLDAVFDRAAIGLSAEMLGTFGEAFERTLGDAIHHRERYASLRGF